MIFVNGYDLKRRAGLTRLVRPIAGPATPAGGMLALGESAGAGLALRIDAAGKALWTRTYQEGRTPLRFIDGAPAADGGFLLLGVTGDGPLRVKEDSLVRIDSAGAVLWSRRVPNQGYGAMRLVRAGGAPEEFVLLGRFPRTPDRYRSAVARLARLDAKGELLGAVELSDDSGGRLLDLAALADGYVLVGDGGDGRPLAGWATMGGEADLIGRYGLVIELDRRLAVRGAWRLPPPRETKGLSVRLVLAPARDRLVVAGCLQAGDIDRQVFVADLARTGAALTVRRANSLRMWNPAERPVAADILGEELAILLHPDAAGTDATVLRLGPDLSPTGNYGAVPSAGKAVIADLRASAPNVAVLVSGVSEAPTEPFMAGLAPDFKCCTMRDLDPRIAARLPLKTEPAKVQARGFELKLAGAKVAGAAVDTKVRPLCGEKVGWKGERMLQSPHLDLQASGSDGSDASRGVLLRWFLTGALENHLPKGDAAKTAFGFNKPDDHVSLFRAAWPEPAPVRRLDLAVDRPVHVDDLKRLMLFQLGPAADPDRFAIRFDDAVGYAAAKQSADPMQDPYGFVTAYGARPFEVELRARLAIACDLGFTANAGGNVQLEMLSAADAKLLTPRQVFARRVLGQADGPVKRLVAENLRGLRLKCTGARAQSFAFICYEDVLAKINAVEGWTPLGRFALTLDDATAFRRLEEPGRFKVDGLWRKYNDGACVRVQNYRNRWSQMPAGLREGVRSYIQLSDADPTATLTVAGGSPGDGAIQLSYLDLLQVVGNSDFHAARMLGLGHVDEAVDAADRSIHIAAYVSHGDLRDGRGKRPVQHLYMSLPTGLADARLPLPPELDGVHYGLSVPTASGQPHQLTDPQGYTADCDARYIRLYPGCARLYAVDQSFWTPSDLFDLSASSLPVLYGVEYRKQGEAVWRETEIAHDPGFLDTRTPPRPESRSTPFPVQRYDRPFVHKETEPGVHLYAAYTVNIFSRASPVCPPVTTDATSFRRRNTLLPPSDLLVQFIEPESPLLLTTEWEQEALGDFATGADRSFVRLCCNYGFAQDLAYPFADRIEILHRREIPRNVKGALKSTAPDVNAGRLRIETRPYVYPSTSETIAPDLPSGLKPNFIGGILVAGAARLVIEDILWPGAPGPNPIFIVRQPTNSGVVVNAAGQNTLVTQDSELDAHPGDLIMAIENMAASANWGGGNPLATTVAIGDSSWKFRTESFARADGSTVSRKLRGVWENAEVEEIAPKRYEIRFATYSLAPHPQAGAADPVHWWRGAVRVPVYPSNHEDRRALSVVEIVERAGKLVLVAVDESGSADPVLEATGLLVNYYPGYKVYLHAQPHLPNPSLGFDWPRLTPAAGEGTRTTILGVRSRDSGTLDASSNAYRSAVGPPQLITAREIREPLPPQRPMGLLYAAPPDHYNMSSYTMTVAFYHAPFAIAFYRAAASSLLEALYHPEDTLPGILAAIFPPDQFFANRFADLFAYIDGAGASLAAIPLEAGGTYTMPVPDHPDLGLTGQPADDKPRMKAELESAFTPLTEQPLVYAFISTDPDYVPTNRPQVSRNANGDFLPAAEMDLAPMAKRTGPGDAVQFTDFSLDGAMNPDMLFFYCAREISETMEMGKASPISKPVKLINFKPPLPPILRRMTMTPYDIATATNPRIAFELIEPAQVDPIAGLRLFRASDPSLALSVRTMDMIKEFDLALLPRTADGSILAVDDFADDPLVPYGDPLFYRLAWVREVHYHDTVGTARSAQVLSQPSRTFLANVVDVVNPEPPVPTVTVTPAGGPDLRMVRIAWSPTVHNGTYYVSRLDPSGNWARIGEIETNDATTFLDLPDALPVADEDGQPLYYRFKVDAQGSSGLLNTHDAPVTARLDAL